MEETKLKSDETILIGSNIRELREKTGMKPMEVSRKVQLMGVSLTREALVKIEENKQHISASQFVALAEILGVSFSDLLRPRGAKKD